MVLSLFLFAVNARAQITCPHAASSTERDVLLKLYCATGGSSWTNRTNWGNAVLDDTWHGVTMDSQGKVSVLELSGNNLNGTIPAELGDLTSLRRLWLSTNALSGSIPTELGNLPSLTDLYLHINQLSGAIPTELGSLTSLQHLWLQGNGLSGSIPTELGNLPSLTDLYLHINQLSGVIPTKLGDLTSLRRLYLSDNDLSGTIPTQLGNLPSLIDLYLQNNQLSGTIPTQFGSLTDLGVLNLGRNQLSGMVPTYLGNLTEGLYLNSNELTGTIPTELGNMTTISYLSLAGNELTGTIPAELGDLTNLQDLRLSINALSGSIPPALGKLTNLYFLYLNGNQLTGTIPAELGDLTSLFRLHLYGNKLSGTIPPALGDITSLFNLYLNGNQLTGTIPAELGSLTSLWHLYLQNNQLSGSIPAELGNLPSLRRLYLSDNDLSGTIPTQLGNLPSLTDLYLHINELTGTIPTELGDLTSLFGLRLDYNSNLSGDLPLELTNMTSLATLNVKCTIVGEPSDSAFQTWLTGLTSYTPATACNPVTVTLAGPGGDVREGSTKQITLTLSRGLVSGEALTVQLTFSGAAVPETDYRLSGASAKGVSYNPGATQITFTGPETGETATVARITFTAIDDADTASELVGIGLGINSQTGLGGRSFITVTDNLASFNITVFSPPPPTVPPTVPPTEEKCMAEEKGEGLFTVAVTPCVEERREISHQGRDIAVSLTGGGDQDKWPSVILLSDILERIETVSFELSVPPEEELPEGLDLQGAAAEIGLGDAALGEGESVRVCLPAPADVGGPMLYHRYGEEDWEFLSSSGETVNGVESVCGDTSSLPSLFGVFVMEEDSEPPVMPEPPPVGEGSSGGCSVVSGEAERNGPLGAAFSLLLIISCILAGSGRKRACLGRRLNIEAHSP